MNAETIGEARLSRCDESSMTPSEETYSVIGFSISLSAFERRLVIIFGERSCTLFVVLGR